MISRVIINCLNTQGWALRIRKPSKPINKEVKAFIKSIVEEEKVYGRKIPIEEIVTRIRTTRSSDGVKKGIPAQYLTHSQVQNQIKILSKAPKIITATSEKRTNKNLSARKKPNNKLSFDNNHSDTSTDEEDHTCTDEEDNRALETAARCKISKNQSLIKNFS
ncbi:unnamed protein product [Rotaria magnacalcarata]|uniref:Uncharacterized protein n=1 Tax=Rotaria magnacalcarata TaxID=392030 RepID=A0A816Z476_9BILA|nr:unnamed protein product [Rotaria magnacalcarata]